jgi:hypothetical protein
MLVIAAMFFFNASSIMWWGGFAIGPRYFLPAVPFMALGMGFAFQRWQAARWFGVLAAVLAAWSLVVNGGITLAGQSFPPDTIFNPLFDYALPNWLAGNIARNLGTVLGLKGAAGLIPLFFFWAVAFAIWKFSAARASATHLQPQHG